MNTWFRSKPVASIAVYSDVVLAGKAIHLKRYSFKSAPSKSGRRRIPRLHFLPLSGLKIIVVSADFIQDIFYG